MNDNSLINLVVGPIATNCWIYLLNEDTACAGGSEAAVIDPGDEADVIISTLKKKSLTLKYILLTHGHFDHICAVSRLKSEYPDAKIAIHALDAEYLGPEAYKAHERSVKSAMGSSDFIDVLWENLPSADIILEEGSEIGPFTVLHLPGHTPGSIAFWDKKEGLMFTGDTLFYRGFGRTDLPGGNQRQLMESLTRLFAMDGGIKVFPGHGDITTIGQECG